MKRKSNIIKIIWTILIAVMLISMLTSCVSASITLPSDLSSVYDNDDGTIGTIGGKIIWVVQTIFYGAAVILVIWSGVKFVIAAPEAKAELKKKFIYMVVGAVFLFAAGGITTIIGNMAMNNI